MEVEDDEEDEEDDDDAEEDSDDEEVEEDFSEINPEAITSRRTRGKKVDYTSAEALAKAGLAAEGDDDDDEEMKHVKGQKLRVTDTYTMLYNMGFRRYAGERGIVSRRARVLCLDMMLFVTCHGKIPSLRVGTTLVFRCICTECSVGWQPGDGVVPSVTTSPNTGHDAGKIKGRYKEYRNTIECVCTLEMLTCGEGNRESIVMVGTQERMLLCVEVSSLIGVYTMALITPHRRTRSWHDAFRRPVTSSLGTVVGRHGGLLSGLPCTDRSNLIHGSYTSYGEIRCGLTQWRNGGQIVSAWEHAIDPDGRLDCTRSFVSGIR
ncbi:hypothetical protein IMY05_C4757000200 [Salix suchowensis]|nr:hypothetical protein IMY05_C4757000200 [Salix suchowensis]